jgi:hypothetical protein
MTSVDPHRVGQVQSSPVDCGCAHTPTGLGGTRLCCHGWIKLPLKFRACAASLGH